MADERSTGSRSSSAYGGSAIPTVTGFEEDAVTADINVTPMVDVMLVLLIIFMVVTPVLASYEATPPRAIHVVAEPDDDVITMGIDAEGAFYVENEPVRPEQLAPHLRAIYARRPGDHLLFLRGHEGVRYSVVLEAIEAARAAGVRTIGAITTPESDDAGGEEG